jgi:hypothetical protein
VDMANLFELSKAIHFKNRAIRWFLWTITASFVIFSLSMVYVGTSSTRDGYKKGQIDAINGKWKYKQEIWHISNGNNEKRTDTLYFEINK